MNAPPTLVKIDAKGRPPEALERAAAVIRSGGVVAFPTESFYGLAVDALDEKALRRLFEAKRRHRDQPILLLVHGVEAVEHYVTAVPDLARILTDRFWPGGLTLVFEAKAVLSPLLTAGTGKIGIRVSGHPIARELAGSVGGPITGTSANTSGSLPCVSADEVLDALAGAVDLILDGGRTRGGRGSTVLDVTVRPPAMLREGMVSREEIQEAIGLSPAVKA